MHRQACSESPAESKICKSSGKPGRHNEPKSQGQHLHLNKRPLDSSLCPFLYAKISKAYKLLTNSWLTRAVIIETHALKYPLHMYMIALFFFGDMCYKAVSTRAYIYPKTRTAEEGDLA